MSHVASYRSGEILPSASAARADASRHAVASDLSVEVADVARLAEIRPDWTDLLTRTANPNVFMDPAVIAAAAAATPGTPYRTLLVWKPVDDRRQLAGLWAFAVGRPPHSALPLSMLFAPRERHGHLSSPVIDRSNPDETLDAMLDCVANDPHLPKMIALDMVSADGPVHEALQRVLTNRHSTPYVFGQSQRPKLASELDGKSYLEKSLSSSTRKKLRQHRRRLSEKGVLTSTIVSEPAAVRSAMEEFLTLEASGWKGKQGTALLSNEGDAAFMRASVGGLAEHGCASLHVLSLDGKPVSMQIVARSGEAAFTWKTTYDEALHDFSPGSLLLEDYTAALLADKSIAFTDSCSYDDSGFMAAWTERIAVANVWFDARRGGSLAFQMVSGAQHNYWRARSAAKRAYQAWQDRKKRHRKK